VGHNRDQLHSWYLNEPAELLMTFGLTSSIRVLPPKAWVSAIIERFLLEQQDDQRKALRVGISTSSS
jgi:hypothetical protein